MPQTSFPPRSIAIVFGTRPEIVKLSGIVRILGPAARIIHTGQHYDDELSRTFLEEFEIPEPDTRLAIGGERRGAQIGLATEELDRYFTDDPASAVVVQGDTNTVVSGALAANASEIPLVHVEAGLRSGDRRMPEEHNRVIADHLADLLLAPTDVAVANLAAEGISGDRVVLTGNTVVEAVHRILPGSVEQRRLLDEAGVPRNGFVLATFHRPENVDDPERLAAVLDHLGAIPLPVLLPLHPRTRQRIEAFGLEPLPPHINVTPPIGYRDFLGLAAVSAFIVSDSGGVQEEASVLKRPVIVVRRSTERPEVLGTFAELVEPGPALGEVAEKWLADLDGLHRRLADLDSPYGDETAPQRSVDAIMDLVDA